jgi:hypothetical protein
VTLLIISTIHSYKNARKDRLPYLWAVIMEVSRMYPAVPGGMPRVVPKGGAIIAGKYIPEEVSEFKAVFRTAEYSVLTFYSRQLLMYLSGRSTMMPAYLKTLSNSNQRGGYARMLKS